MKEYKAPDIRNFALVGHGSSGKTMLAEAMLATSGEIGRLGSIENGTAVADFHPDEKAHQISIHATVVRAEWLDRKFNIIDCPGFADFTAEHLSALRVSDFALVVANATSGIEVGTDQVWDAATLYGLPRILVINQLDKEHTRFDEVLEEAREHFGSKVFPMTLPIDAGPGFKSILDVMRSEVITFATDGSGKFTEQPAEGALKEKVNELHRQLIEYVAEADDETLERFFETGSLTEEEMRSHIHDAVQGNIFVPLFCTSATQNVGVARLMDFIAKYGPSPLDKQHVDGKAEDGSEVDVALDDKETVAFVFKTMNEAHMGNVSFFRVYSGQITSGSEVYNPNTQSTERIGQIFSICGPNRETVKALNAGDIGATVKLKSTHTGNTLCSPSRPVKLERIDFPEPNTHGALEANSQSDLNKLAEGLALLHEEDPTFRYKFDDETGQTIISGQGEIQLQVATEELKRRFNVEVRLIPPRVPFRETIKGKGETRYRHKKQTGGAGQFAEVWLRVESGERNSGVQFGHSLVGNNVDRVFVPSVEKGVRAACAEGFLAGYPVVDVKVDFFDGKQHPVDSKDIAFQIAGKAAFHEACAQARPCLLEPYMNLRITVPSDVVGDIMADLSGRRGRVMGVESDGKLEVVVAQAPQAELYNYSSRLRAITAGRGAHRESFSHYEEMPPDMQQRIVEEAKAARAAGH